VQNQESVGILRIGLTQEFQKFNQFTNARIEFERNKNLFAVNLGISAQKASQQLFAPAVSMDYAHLWKMNGIFLGPVICFSIDKHVFGTRFLYLHSSIGYRFAVGKHVQFFQETSAGPTTESFTNKDQKNQQFTWNYHVKFGVQYVIR
jgi:glutamine amidotransferase-like uncharacterized protein